MAQEVAFLAYLMNQESPKTNLFFIIYRRSSATLKKLVGTTPQP